MTETVVALGIVGDVELLGEDLKSLCTDVLTPLMGMIFVLMTWNKSKSLWATAAAVLGAAAIWWGVSHMELLRDKAGTDLKQTNTAMRVVERREAIGRE